MICKMSSFAGGKDPGSGSSGLACTSKKKTSWTRRSWTVNEKECLLVAMKEIVALGWKSDNSFKPGYQKLLEKALQEKFPGTDLKGTPHIHSKITQWKKNYVALQDILSRSGVGFNTRGDFMIDCPNELWEQVGKGDLKSMRYKPWPYYKAWQEVFGNDRATGEIAKDMLDAANNLNADEDAHMGTFEHDTEASAEDKNPTDDHGDSTSQAAKGQNYAKAKGKKRSGGSDLDGICEVLDSIGNKADARLAEMVKRMGFEFDVKATKKEAFRLLDFIPGLDLKQKFYVCQILAKELDKLDVFMGLHDEMRPSYVLFLLEEAGKL